MDLALRVWFTATGMSPLLVGNQMARVAVTICIKFSDYLDCVVGSRVHFDCWVVVTVPLDRATHALCEKYGIECIDRALLQAGGKDFHAVENKGRMLDEGIEHVMLRSCDALAAGGVNGASTHVAMIFFLRRAFCHRSGGCCRSRRFIWGFMGRIGAGG